MPAGYQMFCILGCYPTVFASRIGSRYAAFCSFRGQCVVEGGEVCVVSYRDVKNAAVAQLQPTAGTQFG